MSENTAAVSSKTETKVQTVKMLNGDVVDFVGNRRLLKSSYLTEEGKVGVKLQFLNGETRTFVLPDSLLLKFAAHGALQKFGDEISSIKDLDDAVLAIDELNDRIQAGEWVAERAAGAGLSGMSILARALMEVMGKSAEEVRKALASKTMAEKQAMRNSARLKPTIDRLEAEKAAKAAEKGKKAGVDGEAALASLFE